MSTESQTTELWARWKADQWLYLLQKVAMQIKTAGVPINLQRRWTMRQLHDLARDHDFRLTVEVGPVRLREKNVSNG